MGYCKIEILEFENFFHKCIFKTSFWFKQFGFCSEGVRKDSSKGAHTTTVATTIVAMFMINIFSIECFN